MSEIVYILTNESMPGIIKIGRTNRTAEIRARDLDTTALPTPHEVHYAAEVEDSQQDEHWLHNIFADRRVRDNREFFTVDPERVVVALKRIEVRDVTKEGRESNPLSKEEEQQVEEVKKRRSAFDFEQYGITVGEEIYFSRDENEKATVLKANKIQWRGEETTTSASGRELMGCNVSGPVYWMYDGETLDERRRRMDGEK